MTLSIADYTWDPLNDNDHGIKLWTGKHVVLADWEHFKKSQSRQAYPEEDLKPKPPKSEAMSCSLHRDFR
jgi:hypothetical protein